VKSNKDAISIIQGQQKAETDSHFTRVEGRISQLENWKGSHLQDIETINQLQTDMNTLKDRVGTDVIVVLSKPIIFHFQFLSHCPVHPL
jgi:hypothetical protein